MRASLETIKNSTDKATTEMISMQLFEEVHDIARKVLINEEEFEYTGETIEVKAKSVDKGKEIKVGSEKNSKRNLEDKNQRSGTNTV